MSVGGAIEGIGDNVELTLNVIENVTFYFVDTTKTSADNTATAKYIDNAGRIKYFNLRSDQTIQIISINGVTMTDPYTCIINKSITEKWDTPIIFKMVLRPTVAGTNIKLRVRGR